LTVSEGGLKAVIPNSGTSVPYGGAFLTMSSNMGNFYCEVQFDVTPLYAVAEIGLVPPKTSFASQSDTSYLPAFGGTSVLCNGGNATVYTINASAVGTFAQTTSDIFMMAFNSQTGKVWFGKNGTWFNSGDPANNSAHMTQLVGGVPAINSRNSGIVYLNCGQRPFAYTPPTGYNTLSIPNIAEYTSDLESPDLVWIKSRNAATNHMLFDSAKGANRYTSSNLTSGEVVDVNSLVSFNKNGFYLGNNTAVNTLNNTYVAWMWKKNTSLGIDVIRTPQNAQTNVYSFNHSLGVKPSMIIMKSQTAGSANFPYYVAHKSLGNGQMSSNWLALNSTSGNTATNIKFGLEPTSAQFSYRVNNTDGGIADQDYAIVYLFAEIEGFSKFGSYTGNGSGDGPFVYCGGSPRFILIKRTDAASDWFIWDVERDSINPADAYLLSNTTGIETGTLGVDIISNGFKLRSTVANVSTGTYIFAAFMQNPFKYSTAK
jgi:hypothetical protein